MLCRPGLDWIGCTNTSLFAALLPALLPAGLTGLKRLRIARRPFLTDAQLAPLLDANRCSLRRLELAGCAALTDKALLHLLPLSSSEKQQLESEAEAVEHGVLGEHSQAEPQGQEQEARPSQPAALPLPPLQHLQLVCCDRMAGSSLRQLPRLRSLRLSGCPAITEASLQVGGRGAAADAVSLVPFSWSIHSCCCRACFHQPPVHPPNFLALHTQAAAICCTQLTLLELPSHIPSSAMPVAPAGAASHLAGLQLVGGMEERGGGGGRRRGERRG